MTPANNISPAGIGVLVFTVAFSLLAVFIVPPLINPKSVRAARPVAIVALISGIFVSLLLASLGALHGTADLRPTTDGRFYASEHGVRTEISPAAHKFGSIITVVGAASVPILAASLMALSSIQRNANSNVA
jgi:hypothetical protein